MESESLRKVDMGSFRNSIVAESKDVKLEYNGNIDIISMVKHNRLIDLYKLLRRMPSTDCLYQRDPIGLTPLHWACKRGDIKIVQLLLNFDASISA